MENKLEIIDAYEDKPRRTKKRRVKTKTVLRKVEPRKSKRVLGLKLMYFSMFFIPLFTCFLIVSTHSKELINEFLTIILVVLNLIAIAIFLIGLAMALVNKKVKTGKKIKTWCKAVALIFLVAYTVGGLSFTYLLYGPSHNFRDWLVTSAMGTMRHRHLATWFYGEEDRAKVFARHNLTESKENTDLALISFDKPKKGLKTFKNRYDEEVLTREENQGYKMIDIDRKSKHSRRPLIGKLAVIYDPADVKLAVTSKLGVSGEDIFTLAKKNDGLIAINAGGFFDENLVSNGGRPHGMIIQNGKLLANAKRAGMGGGVIGFTEDNKLILSRMTADEAMKKGIRDAVDFGPFLIVNGKAATIKGGGGFGTANRTVIGQRSDGIVLFLVLDGRRLGVLGADMNDLIDIMRDYGAINAVNLDGGTSTGMVYDGKIQNITTNSQHKRIKPRRIPNAWIYVPKEEHELEDKDIEDNLVLNR